MRAPLCSGILAVLIAGGTALASAAEIPSAEEIRAAAAELVKDGDVVYVSDYFSFASVDGGRPIAFALDTNRGRAGEAYQAEHFVTLYDGAQGWVDIPGYADYPNDREALLDLPSSPYFTFAGASLGPVTITSTEAPLVLEVGAITPYFLRQDASVLFSLGSAAATLQWQGRRIPGRVIYEYLVMRGSNRLSRMGLRGLIDALGSSPNFQGLYLASADGQDLYLQLSLSSAASALTEPLVAFHTERDAEVPMRNLTLEISDYEPALGFYRWPVGWRAVWDTTCGRATLEVAADSRQIEKNWVIGGFGMEALSGVLSCEGREVPVFGFGELIR